MSPAMSNLPWVDNDFVFVPDNTDVMLDSCFALSDVSLVLAWAISPSVADNIAVTSAPVLVMTSMFKSLKSCICVEDCDKARSRDWISVNLDEHMHLR